MTWRTDTISTWVRNIAHDPQQALSAAFALAATIAASSIAAPPWLPHGARCMSRFVLQQRDDMRLSGDIARRVRRATHLTSLQVGGQTPNYKTDLTTWTGFLHTFSTVGGRGKC